MTSVLTALAKALDSNPKDAGLMALSHNASLVEAPKNHRLFSTGDVCENFVLVAEGQVRVQLSTKSGREMILFRLEPGQSCALTTSCLLTDSPYYAEGIAETPLKLIMIPAATFRSTLSSHPKLSIRLLDNYAQRIGQLTSVIDRLMSRDLGAELKIFLLEKADKNHKVKFSHQKIADELGSSREVISRKLKLMEKAGLISLSRGLIKLTGLES